MGPVFFFQFLGAGELLHRAGLSQRLLGEEDNVAWQPRQQTLATQTDEPLNAPHGPPWETPRSKVDLWHSLRGACVPSVGAGRGSQGRWLLPLYTRRVLTLLKYIRDYVILTHWAFTRAERRP
jgi:hypothetical protein